MSRSSGRSSGSLGGRSGAESPDQSGKGPSKYVWCPQNYGVPRNLLSTAVAMVRATTGGPVGSATIDGYTGVAVDPPDCLLGESSPSQGVRQAGVFAGVWGRRLLGTQRMRGL